MGPLSKTRVRSVELGNNNNKFNNNKVMEPVRFYIGNGPYLRNKTFYCTTVDSEIFA